MRWTDRHAARLFARAADGARKNGFPQDEALANERAARQQFARGLAIPPEACLPSAATAYVASGAAAAKVAKLRGEFPALAGSGRCRNDHVS